MDPGQPSVRWRWLAPLLVLVVGFHFSPLRETLDRAAYDTITRRLLPPAEPPPGSALLLFDNATLAALSARGLGVTWPPPRGVFAAVIAALDRAGAERIVLDFVFLERSTAEEQDQLLGGLAAAVPGVVLGGLPGRPIAVWDEAFQAEQAGYFVAPRTGSVEANTDSDGVIRAYRLPGSLAAAAAGVAATHPGGLLRWSGGVQALQETGDRVPVLSAARFVIAGLEILDRVEEAAPDFTPGALSAALAREPELTGPGFDAVRGRIVFVGANAEGTFDQKPLAIGGVEPGVLVHWTAWANLRADRFVRPAPGWAALALAAAVVGGLLLMARGRVGLRFLAVGAAGAVGAVALVVLLGFTAGVSFPPSTAALAGLAATTGLIAESYWREHRRRREVQAMFGSYVAPAVVERLVRDPASIRLAGERREATVFFCDLAGFTDLSEQVTAEELIALVNGYLQETSECLLEHGAYVDKFIGDAVMAVFGAPERSADHAGDACRAALEAQRLLARRNETLQREHGRTLHMRIGINTGEMVVGNVGSDRKRNYTVLGDAVNLASRLEGANKEFGTEILLGETTAARVDGRFVTRPLTHLRVKGRQTAVRVHELVGTPESVPAEKRRFLAAYARGHALYTTRCFVEAVEALSEAAAFDANDVMTQRLLHQARTFSVSPPPPDWQPTLALETK